jgi:nitroreductase/NAD-dependent dihydropyrimidine dehydrogenase PreA subunit
MTRLINISEEKCIGCGLCAKDCLAKIIKIRDGKAVIDDMRACIFCGHCGAVCPVNAIEFVEDGYSDDIMEFENFKNVDYEALNQMIHMKRSVRQFKDKPVDMELINKIVEIGRVSPTASNGQPLKFTVVNSAEKLEELKLLSMNTLYEYGQKLEGRYKQIFSSMLENYKETGFDRLFHNATSLIVIYGDSKGTFNLDIDGGIAGGQMTLIAETLGLGSCFIGFLNFAASQNSEIFKFLKIPEGNKMIANIALGYKDVEYLRTVPRKKQTVNYL